MANAAFTALLNNVYSITGRSDLVADTTYAVRAATIKLHQIDFFPKDLAEAKINFTVADYFQTLQYRTLFARWRAAHYLRKYENGEVTQFLTAVSPDNILDSYGVSKENIYYLAGDVLQIRSDTKITDVLLGYYQNPITDPDTYSSWIASIHPTAIEAEAAQLVFKMIGFDEQAAMYTQLAKEQALIVKNSNILAEG